MTKIYTLIWTVAFCGGLLYTAATQTGPCTTDTDYEQCGLSKQEAKRLIVAADVAGGLVAHKPTDK
jgi:hypothetical protein